MLENGMSNLSRQGVDNYGYMFQSAKYRTLAGEYDQAITQLEHAIDRGFQSYKLFVTLTPMFEPLRDDPRFVAAQAAMVENINVEREALGLEPVDPQDQRWY